MNLSELRTALQQRGFNHLTTGEQNTALNYAYQVEICESEDWPFLEATTSGVAPKTVSDIRSIESVINSTQNVKLSPLDRRGITDTLDTDLTTVGSPTHYYLTAGNAVSVYPANTSDSLSIRYYKVPEALSADANEPIIPERFHPLIVDAAVKRAYEAADEWDAAGAADVIFQQRLAQMRESLMATGHDLPDDYVVLPAGVWE